MDTKAVSPVALYDPKLVSPELKYKVLKSASSLTNDDFQANTASNTKLLFNVHTTRSSYTNRCFIVSYERYLQFDVKVGNLDPASDFGAGNGAANGTTAHTLYNPPSNEYTPVVVIGRDLAMRPFPLMKQAESINLKIGSQSFTEESSYVQPELDLLMESDEYQKEGGEICPVSVSKLALNSARVVGKYNSMLGCDKSNTASSANGAWYDVSFLDNTNTELDKTTTGTYPDGSNTISHRYGIPILSTAGGNMIETYKIRLKVRISHPIRMSPLAFNRSEGLKNAFYGIDKCKLSMQLSTDLSKSWMWARDGDPQRVRTMSNLAILNENGSSIQNAVLRIQSMSGNPTLPAPMKSVHPYMEFERNTSTKSISINPAFGAEIDVSSDTFNISQVPQYLMLTVKPSAYDTSNQGCETNQWYMPIVKVRVKFAKVNEQLSSHHVDQLFEFNYKNGIRVDRNVYQGNGFGPDGQRLHLLGAPLLLRFGREICLPSDLAPGVATNCTLSVTVTVQRPYNSRVAGNGFIPGLGYTTGVAVTGDVKAQQIFPNPGTAAVDITPLTISNLELNCYSISMGHLVVDAKGNAQKQADPITREDVVRAKFDPSQLADEGDHKLGGSFWSHLTRGISTVGRHLMPIVDKIGPKIAEKVISKKLGLGNATTMGGARKYRMDEIF